MKDYKITIALCGIDKEGGYIRLGDFIGELQRFAEIARNAEEVVSGKMSNSIYYRIIDLKHSSPASVTIQACVKDPKYDIREATIKEITETMKKLQTGEEIKGHEKFNLVESIRNFAEPVGKRISHVQVVFEKDKVNVDQEFRARVNLYTAPEETAHSSFRGMLDIINIHNQNAFWLYPEIGPNKIQCTFPDKLFELAKASLGRKVEVTGLFKYKMNAPYPHAAEVDSMVTLPSDDELPTFKDLFKIDPDITGGLSSEDYIRKLRGEN